MAIFNTTGDRFGSYLPLATRPAVVRIRQLQAQYFYGVDLIQARTPTDYRHDFAELLPKFPSTQK